MKHLTKFMEYLKESKEELDLDLIVNDFLVPIRHLGISIDTNKSLLTTGEFAGYNETTISFGFSHFDRVDKNITKSIKDERIWEFLDELMMFKSIMYETYGNLVSIWFMSSTIRINIYSKVEENDQYLIEKLSNELIEHYNTKIHYFVSKEKDNIVVYISGTRKIWNSYVLLNKIDLSKFDLKFTEDTEDINKYWNAKVKIEITVKK
jgi:hypothetical protein